MKILKYILPVFLSLGALTSVLSLTHKAEEPVPPLSTYEQIDPDPNFGDYWYQGQAELASYQLEQSRYGEIHAGHAVLVFVTEPFSKSKQVKLDYPERAQEGDQVSILKLNFVKKFNTGIYPYSIMSSVFTPVEIQENPHSLKVTTTTQEWCGHTFTQINLENNQFQAQTRSYFESEGDQNFQLARTILEDEIWNRIRIAPQSLPTGDLQVIPSTMVSRLIHRPLAVEKAQASLDKTQAGEQIYTLYYPALDRELKIRFESQFPYKILGWEDTYAGLGGKKLTTKATLKETLKTDYWNKHHPADTILRKKLGLQAKDQLLP